MRCRPRSPFIWALLSLGLGACFDLDGFVHNPIHCSAVSAQSCEEEALVWDKICTPCAQPYDFARDYPWMEGTLSTGQVLRAVDTSHACNM